MQHIVSLTIIILCKLNTLKNIETSDKKEVPSTIQWHAIFHKQKAFM